MNTTTICFIVLAIALAGTRFDIPEPSKGAANGHIVQAVLLFLLLSLWSFLTVKVAEILKDRQHKPSNESKVQEVTSKYPQDCKDAKISIEWFDAWTESLNSGARCLAFLILVCAAVLAISLLPRSFLEYFDEGISKIWTHALNTWSHKSIFIWGIMLAHLLPFYASTVFFMLLDVLRPKALVPFKIQENVKISAKQYAQALAVATMNQILLVGAIHLMWIILPDISPRAFDAELPSLLTFAVQLVVCLPVSEIIFYSTHRLLHTDWFWNHIHYFHHEQSAPFPPCCIYAHPLEFVMANIPVVACGPMISQAHMIVWITWCFLATFSTAVSHSGWHLPLLPGESEGHDYHHSSGFMDNLGVIGTLDIVFGTEAHYNKSWQKRVDKNYGLSPMYPFDKILARNEIDTESATDAKGESSPLESPLVSKA